MKFAFDGFITSMHGDQTYHCGPHEGGSGFWTSLITHLLNNKIIQKDDIVKTEDVVGTDAQYIYPIIWRYFYSYPHTATGYENHYIIEKFKWLENSKVIDDVRAGKCLIVFYDSTEGERNTGYPEPTAFVDKFKALCKHLQIPPKSVVKIDGNFKAHQFEDAETPHFLAVNLFEDDGKNYVYIDPSIANDFQHPLDKPLRFLSYSRHWNDFRQQYAFELWQRGLLKKGLLSLSSGGESDEIDIQKLQSSLRWINKDDCEYHYPEYSKLKQFLSMLPLEVDTHLRDNLAHTFVLDHYLKTDFSIVNETYVDNSTMFLTEKTWKTMMAKHPFIMVSGVGTLQFLRSEGYRTFSPFFNEEYDEIESVTHRKNAIIKEVMRLCSLTKRERTRLYAGIGEITTHNRNVLMQKKNNLAQVYQQLCNILRSAADRLE